MHVGVLISFWLFLFAVQTKEFFLDGLKKLEQRSHKCWSSGGEYVEQIYSFFFNPVACRFLYKAKDLSAPLVNVIEGQAVHPFLKRKNSCSNTVSWYTRGQYTLVFLPSPEVLYIILTYSHWSLVVEGLAFWPLA
jgi:hypothetical protein